ncbi:hypothetical protein BB561_004837 [Smittium simulii]|uniref:Ubiquitin-like domain-containing protein n=1 Tax=Smittium simulii TaxID=133385 RepID=A0A2T9YDX7_9FUNG|nr:hypothetical protein BB561_004837 [Smittium simulii]
MKLNISALAYKSLLFPTKKSSLEIEVSNKTSISEVKSIIAKKIAHLTIYRQRISDQNKKPFLDDNATLEKLEVKDGDTLIVKDLGPQISWTLVFLVEYAGPILIHSFFYHFSSLAYGKVFEHSKPQKYLYFMALFHYFKRELETVFVHRFSLSTMPYTNIFKNSAHYYILGGLFIAYPNYSPILAEGSPFASSISDLTLYLSLSLFLFFEFSNLITHITLRNLRPAGTTIRNIPKGYGFDLVSCPNYLFEIMSWVAYSLISRAYIWVFIAFSTFQMFSWAIKKHKRYIKDFSDYPKTRKAIFPYII